MAPRLLKSEIRRHFSTGHDLKLAAGSQQVGDSPRFSSRIRKSNRPPCRPALYNIKLETQWWATDVPSDFSRSAGELIHRDWPGPVFKPSAPHVMINVGLPEPLFIPAALSPRHGSLNKYQNFAPGAPPANILPEDSLITPCGALDARRVAQT